MSDTIEKIYCMDHGNGGNDALYALLANLRNQENPLTMMTAMNNQGQMFNNPWIYFVWMFMMRWMNGGYGENGGNNPQIAALQNQMQDNQNSNMIMDAIKGNDSDIRQLSANLNVDFNTLTSAIHSVRNGIDLVAGQVGLSTEKVINAVNMGDFRVTEALNKCCCETQKELIRMLGNLALQTCEQTNTLRNGQRDLQVALDKGFATTAFETQKQTCEIVNTINAAQQRTADLLNNHWTSELANKYQDQKFENSQLKQNIYLSDLIKEYAAGAKAK